MRRLTFKVLPILTVLISSLMLSYLFSALTLLALVPWDTAIARPEIGTWQRTVNDFFEGRFGENVVILFFIMMTTLPIFNTLRERWYLSARVTLTNILFLIVGYGGFIASSIISYIILPYRGNVTDPFFHNYTRSSISLLAISVIFCFWFLQIKSMPKYYNKQKNKAKNTQKNISIHRLTDAMTEDDAPNYQDNHVQSEHFASQ